mmetsp:Transcript_26752/g.23562  ORF Transcript_26752/g.23562 Transcript_26752/m.23562 type:complete len:507 (-) Transcript_26752:266-1786(-)
MASDHQQNGHSHQSSSSSSKPKNGHNNGHAMDLRQSAPFQPTKSKPKQSRYQSRVVSAPFSNKEASAQPEHSNAFPKRFTYSGYLDIRQKKSKPWKRRYFVVNNNFLLCAATPHAQKLEGVYPLEGSSIKTKKSSKHTSDDNGNMTFELFIRKHQLFFRAASPQQCSIWKEHIQKASKLKIKDIYRFLYTLGTSGMTKVVAAKHRTTNEDSAIKIIDKRMCDKKMLKTEIQILKKLDSPYIVSLYDLIETKKYLYIVMEKCEGGELFDQIAELDGDHYSEEDCCLILHQIAKGVKYMHKCGIVHRDLKPDNLMYLTKAVDSAIKIIDFGLAGDCNLEPCKTPCGTAHYAAPEVLSSQPYNQSADMWSLGVIIYTLLCGFPPFFDASNNMKNLYHLIKKGQYSFPSPFWDDISENAKDLIRKLLVKDPNGRLNAGQVLQHPWVVNQSNAPEKELGSQYVKQMSHWQSTRQATEFGLGQEAPPPPPPDQPINLYYSPEQMAAQQANDQ